jgi:hypothetical protein
MENFVKKILSVTKTDLEKLKKELEAVPVCRPINDLKEAPRGTNGGVAMWLNPSNQKCFNFGWFCYQDFHDWAQGKGNIIKGKTDEEKKKFWDVAVFEEQHNMAWAIGWNKKYFDLIDETYHPEFKKGYGYYSCINKPLKLKKGNEKEIIAKMFGYVCRDYGDTCFELTSESHALRRMRDELIGVKETLFNLGIGYYGASNTPTEPENLSWIADICEYKAVYLSYIKNGIVLPDFDFVYNYNEYGK